MASVYESDKVEAVVDITKVKDFSSLYQEIELNRSRDYFERNYQLNKKTEEFDISDLEEFPKHGNYWKSENAYLRAYRDKKHISDKAVGRIDIDMTSPEMKEMTDFGILTGLDFACGYHFRKRIDKQKDGTESRGYFKAEWHTDYRALSQHLSGYTTIALPKFPYTTMYIIDIDRRKNKGKHFSKILDTLAEYLGNAKFAERSKFNGGYHVYYKFDERVPDSFSVFLRKYFKETYDYDIEPIYGKQAIRIPYSKAYSFICGVPCYDKQIKNHKGELVNNTYRLHRVYDFESVYQIFNNMEEQKFTPWMRKHITYGEPIHNRKTNTAYGNSSDPIEEIRNFELRYGAGTRHIYQPKIAVNVLMRNGSYSDFVNFCYRFNDGTSKDMKNPEIAEPIMEQVWRWAESFAYTSNVEYQANRIYDSTTERSNSNFHYHKTNEYFLDLSKQERLYEIFEFFYRSMNYGKIGGKTEERFLQDCVKWYGVIDQKRWYKEKSKTHYDNRIYGDYQFLNSGVLFDGQFQKNVAKHLNIPNPFRLTKFFCMIDLLDPVRDPNYGYTWSYKRIRYAKHYLVNKIDQLERNIAHIKSINQSSSDDILKAISALKFQHEEMNNQISSFNNELSGFSPKTIPFGTSNYLFRINSFLEDLPNQINQEYPFITNKDSLINSEIIYPNSPYNLYTKVFRSVLLDLKGKTLYDRLKFIKSIQDLKKKEEREFVFKEPCGKIG